MKNKHIQQPQYPTRLRPRNASLGVLAILGMTLGLNACTNLLNAEPPVIRRYTLLATPSEAASTARGNMTDTSIMVHVGSVGLSLNTDRVMARDELTIAPISDLRWVEAAPDMLEKSLTDFLQQSGQFRYVTHHRGGPKTDRILTVDLRDLYVISADGQARAVQLGLAARLSPETSEGRSKNRSAEETSVVLNEKVDIDRNKGEAVDKAIAKAFSTAAQQAFTTLLNTITAE